METTRPKRNYELKLIDHKNKKTKSISLYGNSEAEDIMRKVKKVFE